MGKAICITRLVNSADKVYTFYRNLEDYVLTIKEQIKNWRILNTVIVGSVQSAISA